MKKILLFLASACASTALFAQLADLDESVQTPATRYFAQPSLLVAAPGGSFDAGFGLGVSGGAVFNGIHSVEGELLGFKAGSSDRDDVDLKFRYLLGTYKYIVDLDEPWSVYWGGSVGFLFQDLAQDPLHPAFAEDSDNGFVFGILAGAQYRIHPRVILDGGVKLLMQGSTEFTGSGAVLLFQVGAKIPF